MPFPLQHYNKNNLSRLLLLLLLLLSSSSSSSSKDIKYRREDSVYPL
jgi:hypothetical protein